MLFVEAIFFPFFLLVFGVHWLLPRHRARKAWLLLASYFFYGFWDWRFLSLILFSTTIDYVVGLKLSTSRNRKAWLAVSLVANLGLLGVFKYLDFFLSSTVTVLETLGFQPHIPTLEIILPVGISFYTFQTLSYSIDIYRRNLEPTRDFLDLALFVSFFPQLVAGPIVRAVEFLPQLRENRVLSRVDFRGAMVLFLIGFFKKACVSDNLAYAVDAYFKEPGNFDSLSAWIATLAYSAQIYADFSGYSDMAIACAALLGYELPLNFRHPYFARSLAEYWQRWHISLSTWLRDYLYIPLGGNRGTNLRTQINLMLTMLLGGLWHGAGWNYVIWGGMHGVGLAVHRAWSRAFSEDHPLRRPMRFLGMPLTFAFICAGWAFFRATNLGDSADMLQGLAFLAPAGRELPRSVLVIFALLVGLHMASQRRLFERTWRSAPAPVFALGYGVVVAFILPLIAVGAEPFIYFQF